MREWKVVVEPVGECVHVYSSKAVFLIDMRSYSEYIYPPCFIERVLGATLESKVRGAIRACQKNCDKLNAEDMRAEEICEIVKGIVK